MMNKVTGNIILVHKGALGDFLLAWPSFLSIRSRFSKAEVFWHGRGEFFSWLKPLGIFKVDSMTARSLDSLYSRPEWPEEVKGFTVFWFGLDRITVPQVHPALFYLKGIDHHLPRHVRKAYATKLQALGIPFRHDWHKTWNKLFDGSAGKRQPVLIFPGSGNSKKNWPLKNYIWIYEQLNNRKHDVRIVLGPADRHLRLDLQEINPVYCDALEQLQKLIIQSRLCLGNDSGPMHLASMHRVPGLVLFGPTSLARWRPSGLKTIKSREACAPCSSIARIECAEAKCMSAIKKEQVLAILCKMLVKQKKPAFLS